MKMIADMSVYIPEDDSHMTIYFYKNKEDLYTVGFHLDDHQENRFYKDFDEAMYKYLQLQEALLFQQDELEDQHFN